MSLNKYIYCIAIKIKINCCSSILTRYVYYYLIRSIFVFDTHTRHFVCIYVYSVFHKLLYKLINSVLLQELTQPLCSVCAFKIIIIAIICKIYRGCEFPLITSFLLYQLPNRPVLLKDVKFVG